MLKRVLLFLVSGIFVGVLGVVAVFYSVKNNLPKLVTVKDYEPRLVTQVFDRNNQKIGEFSRERRILVPFEKIPRKVIEGFLAAEDDQFYKHSGINYLSILRATLANLRAGRSVQGGSTITQQVAKTILLSSEKTITRKLKDMLLALEMEQNLTKEDILYLYLNQIYFGQGAWGIELASQTYFRKNVQDLTLPEIAILAGLPQAPSRYSPVQSPKKAKERQHYVLKRMAEVGFISQEEASAALKEPVNVYIKEAFAESAPPFYLETVRQLLVDQVGETALLDKGLSVYTGLDLKKQLQAQASLRRGLRDLDKRQGYRGPVRNLANQEEIQELLQKEKEHIISLISDKRILLPTGEFAPVIMGEEVKPNHLPPYLKVGDEVPGVVSDVDDQLGLVYVYMPGYQGVIDMDSMAWARKPNPEIRWDQDKIIKPSQALKKGDLIRVRITKGQTAIPARLAKLVKSKGAKVQIPNFLGFAEVELEQDPVAEGALISFDLKTDEIISLVGGKDFAVSEFNRAIQAPRQTGSAFKPIIYAAALEKGYNPSTPIMDAPLVFEEGSEDDEGQENQRIWKPTNHSKSFGGDITFRNALVQSLNVPTVKIIENVGVGWATEYARRLGIWSPLNPDFTVALGSSSVTLYEMTKVFSHFARLGKRIRPLLIRKVVDRNGSEIAQTLSLDLRYRKEITEFEKDQDEKRLAYLEKMKIVEGAEAPQDPGPEGKIYFDDPEQLIRPTTAYLMTSLLKGVVEDPSGTGRRAMALGREVAGKTGTTNKYYDAWFVGYTPQISTGVWVGFDQEKSLGQGEVGGRAALPIWVEYMKSAHQELPAETFPVPEGIVFANIDAESGRLAQSGGDRLIRQAFEEGTEPKLTKDKTEDTTDFLKQDLFE